MLAVQHFRRMIQDAVGEGQFGSQVLTDISRYEVRRTMRAAAVLAWLLGLGFGLPCVYAKWPSNPLVPGNTTATGLMGIVASFSSMARMRTQCYKH